MSHVRPLPHSCRPWIRYACDGLASIDLRKDKGQLSYHFVIDRIPPVYAEPSLVLAGSTLEG